MKVVWIKRFLLILAGICSIYYIVPSFINRDGTIESFGHGSPGMVSDSEQSVKDLCKWTLYMSIASGDGSILYGVEKKWHYEI